MSARDDYFSAHLVKGRGAYVCSACRAPIEKGTLHVSISAACQGRRYAQRMCEECYEVAAGRRLERKEVAA